jgi:hypothetical protein
MVITGKNKIPMAKGCSSVATYQRLIFHLVSKVLDGDGGQERIRLVRQSHVIRMADSRARTTPEAVAQQNQTRPTVSLRHDHQNHQRLSSAHAQHLYVGIESHR